MVKIAIKLPDTSEIVLPTNRKFGLFFTIVFLLISIYIYYSKNDPIQYFLLGLSFGFFTITMVKPSFLTPLNKLWMQFGFLLGMIVSPIILGLIYFSIFTPIAIIMRISGRDELRVKFIRRRTYWRSLSDQEKTTNFRHQF